MTRKLGAKKSDQKWVINEITTHDPPEYFSFFNSSPQLSEPKIDGVSIY